MNGEGWKIENGRASYACGDILLSVGSIGESRLFVAGPVVPLIPFTHEYSGYLTVSASGSSACPAVTRGGSVFKAYEKSEYNQNITCQYKLGTLDQSDEIFLVLSNGSSCKANPLQFRREDDWGYCLVCSA